MTFGFVFMFLLTTLAGIGTARKNKIVILDGDKVMQEVKTNAPATIIVYRDGENIQVRAIKKSELKKLKARQ